MQNQLFQHLVLQSENYISSQTHPVGPSLFRRLQADELFPRTTEFF